MRYEHHNLDGRGAKRAAVYDMPSKPMTQPGAIERGMMDYWAAVTDVPCPCCDGGTIRWAEAGYVPGYRICDGCGRHFLAGGTAEAPTLIRFGDRREKVEK
jgi:hypothetical protein